MSQTAASTGSNHHGVIAALMILLGLIVLAFGAMAIILQVQTSEAFILQGQPVNGVNPDWSILRQPIDFVQGHLSGDFSKAVFWGWGIELTFLVCVLGYEAAHGAIGRSSPRLASWFRTGMILLIAFDGWADFQYGQLASGFWGQVAFAGITAFIVMFFPIIGLRFIEAGFHAWSGH